MQIDDLIERVRGLTGPDNGVDISVEISLFEPDEIYVSVAPNSARTKVVYTRRDGKAETFWAADHTLTPASRAHRIALLSALKAKGARE